MKAVLYMATTANGFIATNNDETPWSKEEWKSFAKKVNETKNLIIGRKTHELMLTDNNFDSYKKSVTVIVVSGKISTNQKFVFVKSPKEAIAYLKEKGFTKALVAGGGKLNSSFMKEGLVDEIILDIEPIVFGKGIKLFSDNDFETKLMLIKTKKINKNTIQLHYKVIK